MDVFALFQKYIVGVDLFLADLYATPFSPSKKQQEYAWKEAANQLLADMPNTSSVLCLRNFIEDVLDLLQSTYDMKLPRFTSYLEMRDMPEDTRQSFCASWLQTALSAPHPGRLPPSVAKLYFEEEFDAIQLRTDPLPCSRTAIVDVHTYLKDNAEYTWSTIQPLAKNLHPTLGTLLFAHLLFTYKTTQSLAKYVEAPPSSCWGYPCQLRNLRKGKYASKTRGPALDYTSVIYSTPDGTYCKKKKLTSLSGLLCSLPGLRQFCIIKPTGECSVIDLHGGDTIRLQLQSNESRGGASVFMKPSTAPLVNDSEINWVDCQRTLEGQLVFTWGFVHATTGEIVWSYYTGLEEKDGKFTGEYVDIKQDDIDTIYFERLQKCNLLDTRDHGNILSLVYHYKYDNDTLKQSTDVVYDNTILFSFPFKVDCVWGVPSKYMVSRTIRDGTVIAEYNNGEKSTLSICLPSQQINSLCCL